MKHPRVNLSPLDTLINKAINLRRTLRHLQEGKKLTFEAFLSEALELADTNKEEIEKLADTIKTAHGTWNAQRFIRKLVSVLKEPQYPRPPRDSARCLNIYGSNEAAIELTNHGGTIAQGICVAILEIYRRFGAEGFGLITSWPEYEKETKALQNKIAGISEKMPDVVSGLDLEFNFDNLNSEAKRLGLCRVTFRRASGIILSDGEWPLRLIEDCERPVPAPAIAPTEIKVRKVHKRRLKRERLAA